jgi:hypothetical protein
MGDWLLGLPLVWIGVAAFAGTYLTAAIVYLAITRLAADETRLAAFRSVSPGMLPPLGIIFGLLVGFTAAQVWSDYDRAKLAVANEASGLRAVVLLAAVFPEAQAAELRSLVSRHIDQAIKTEWPAMSEHHATLAMPPAMLTEALKATLELKPADDGQRLAQSEILASIEKTLEARRQRIVISGSAVSAVKWAGLLLQALITLLAIAMVHSGNRGSAGLALWLFATGIALSIFMIAAYNRPFGGVVAIDPTLLEHVQSTVPR